MSQIAKRRLATKQQHINYKLLKTKKEMKEIT